MSDSRPVCPSCGADDTREIVYGYPSRAPTQEEKVILGGCVVSAEDPRWHCAACEHEWGRAEEIPWLFDDDEDDEPGEQEPEIKAGFRRCPECGRVRHYRYFLTPHSTTHRCIDCWWRRFAMNEVAIKALDPDYELAESPDEPYVPPTPLRDLGYRRALHGIWICVNCAELYEPGKRPDVAQLCRCRVTRGQPRWDGYDFNERVHLCECCCAAVLPSGSRWSTWFCKQCRPFVDELNDTAERTVIPIGRHTLMMRQGLAAGRPDDEEDIDSFVDRLWEAMNEMSSAIDTLADHRKANLKHQLWDADLPQRDIRLVRFLEITRRWHQGASSERSFERLGARFGADYWLR